MPALVRRTDWPGRLDEVDQLRRLDDGEERAEILLQPRGQREDAFRLRLEHLHEAHDFAEVDVGQRRVGRLLRRLRRDDFRLGDGRLVVQDRVGEDGVDLRDELLEGRRGRIARVGQGIRHDLLHAARMRRQHDDVAREIDRLGDVVRDDDQALEAGGGVHGDAADFVAQRLAGEHVERAERLVHAEDLRLHDERARDADALLHAAGKFLRQHVAVAVEADHLDDLLEVLLRSSGV